MTLNWDKSLQTGVKEIDEQHKALFEIFNKLRKAPQNLEIILTILKDLETYNWNHFANEEHYMKSFNYEYYEYHKFLHERFKEEFEEIASKIHDDSSLMKFLPILINFFEVWIQDHYKNADIKLAKFLRCYLEGS